MDDIEKHQAALLTAFAEMLRAEEAISKLKTQADEAAAKLTLAIAEQQAALGIAQYRLQKLMSETGEVEVILPGEVTDFKIGYGPSRESVKVENPDAVPDQFCKLERKPKLKEIGEHLKSLPDSERPNWARLERSEPKLQWKSIKKTAKA